MRTDSISLLRPILLTPLLILGALISCAVEQSQAQDILQSPRTINVDFEQLTTLANENPELNTIVGNNRIRALWLLDDENGRKYSVNHADPVGAPRTHRFNPRRCMRVIMDTAVAARLGGVEIAEYSLSQDRINSLTIRAVNELKKATAQALGPADPRWPWHAPMEPSAPERGTLEAAEATACLAIGYDWLRTSALLTSDDRERSRQAILKGLRRIRDYAALRFQPTHCEDSCRWTQTCSVACWSNWNAVLNGTAIIAATAIEHDVDGDDRAMVIEVRQSALRALTTFPKIFAYDELRPDQSGSYPEGPTYLNYSLEYFALADVALAAQRGTSFGINLTGTGVLNAGEFAIDMLSPSATILQGRPRKMQGLSINFSDGSATVLPSAPVLSWLGKYRNQPRMAAYAQHLAGAQLTDTVKQHNGAYTMDALTALWFSPRSRSLPTRGTRLYRSSDGSNSVAFLRQPTASVGELFAMLKGGKPTATPHGHLDSGSFILEALGRRWSFDLGPESYEAPGYFNLSETAYPNRWSYLRANNHGHSTLSIGDGVQDPDATIPIALSDSNNEYQTTAVADLTSAYRGSIQTARRALTLSHSGSAEVRDALEGLQPGTPVRWQMIYCRAKNPGINLCYRDVDVSPIRVNLSNPKRARIMEETQCATCPTPRFLDAELISPPNAIFRTQKLVAQDLVYQSPAGVRTVVQADNANDSKCYVLAIDFEASEANTSIEVRLAPGQLRRP